MNIIYMGTPDFAVPALKKLYESKHTVQAVFTQPDKPKGRKMVLTPPDVKVCAQELNIPVYPVFGSLLFLIASIVFVYLRVRVVHIRKQVNINIVTE